MNENEKKEGFLLLLTDKKQKQLLCLVFCCIYFVSYLTRYNYSALLNQIILEGALSRSAAAAVSTGAFITYGVGQIVCGFLGDRTNPVRLIGLGLLGTTVCNLLMFFLSSPVAVALVWGANGLFQAMLWPPLVRLAAELLNQEDYTHTIERVIASGSVGSILIYLLAALLIALSVWKSTFLVCSLFGLAALILWQSVGAKLPVSGKMKPKEVPVKEEENKKKSAAFAVIPLVSIGLMIVVQGILRDGVTSWMPGYLTEVLSLSSALSAAISAFMPLFAILGVRLAAALFARIKNELVGASLLFGACAFFCLILGVFFDAGVFLPSLLMALIIGCTHSINSMLIGYLPMRFAALGAAGTAAGLLNACVYVGSALSVYGIALISDAFGWQTTVWVWFFVALFAFGISFLARKLRLIPKEKEVSPALQQD